MAATGKVGDIETFKWLEPVLCIEQRVLRSHYSSMCKETIEVSGFSDTRDAYEVQERLRGMPAVESVEANIPASVLVVEYDEHKLSHEDVLDCIEQNGCTPSERLDGVFGTIRKKLNV